MTEKEICSAALDKFGAEAQTLKLFEETAELQKELCKHAGGANNVAAIAEEIADVQIMLAQMVMLYDCEDNVAWYKGAKLLRLERRLKKGSVYDA